MKKGIIYLLLFCSADLFAQTIIKGRVTDATTNEAIPFVNITFKGTFVGAATDFDGYYSISTTREVDSLSATYLGYRTRTKAVKKGKTQVIDFQLEPDAIGLSAITIVAGENPAIAIIKKAIRNREKYNKESLSAFEYESYTKMQIDVDNISDNLKKRKVLKPVTSLFDSLKAQAGEDGQANMPVFYSESLSDVYYLKDPARKREYIKASKIIGIGTQDGVFSAQFTGSTFEEYNFNSNRLLLFGKEFISPIADAGLLFYEYYLVDSGYVGNFYCYKIKVKPKNDQDLAFTGNIWLVDSLFALKQVNVEITKSTNLNFIEKAQIQQELEPTTDVAWMPVKARIVVDFTDVSKKSVGLLAKLYLSSKNVSVNQPRPLKFYESSLELAEDAILKDDEYWEKNRHEKLSSIDISVYKMVDTIRNIPRVKTAVDVFYTIINGYQKAGWVDIGPYSSVYSYNQVEGSKLRLGFRTNHDFSDKWILRGYIAHGLKDNKLKYNGQVEHIMSRRKWTKIGLQRREDIDQVGFTYDFDDSQAFNSQQSSLYVTSSQISRFSLLNRKVENRAWVESELVKGFIQRITVHNIDYKHFFDVGFESNDGNTLQSDFNTTELVFEGRFALNEYFIQSNNRRLSLGMVKAPVVTLSYTQGIKDLWGSDFNYSKLGVSLRHKLRLGLAGYSLYVVSSGKVLSKIPYTLLEVHRGNQTPFLAGGTFNLMNYFEFVSDQFVAVHYQHHFEGLLFNRIPLLRKLKLRELVSANAVYGGLSSRNSDFNRNNEFNTLSAGPYVEAGFGIENIFYLGRIDVLYRMTYIDSDYRSSYRNMQLRQGVDNPYGIRNFGIMFSLDFQF